MLGAEKVVYDHVGERQETVQQDLVLLLFVFANFLDFVVIETSRSSEDFLGNDI